MCVFSLIKRLGNSVFLHRLSLLKPISFIIMCVCVCLCMLFFIQRIHWECNQPITCIVAQFLYHHPTIKLFSNQLKWIEILESRLICTHCRKKQFSTIIFSRYTYILFENWIQKGSLNHKLMIQISRCTSIVSLHR